MKQRDRPPIGTSNTCQSLPLALPIGSSPFPYCQLPTTTTPSLEGWIVAAMEGTDESVVIRHSFVCHRQATRPEDSLRVNRDCEGRRVVRAHGCGVAGIITPADGLRAHPATT